jgi:3-oxoacyl-[acyl-carrier protein] reductase
MTQRHWVGEDGKKNLEMRDTVWGQMTDRVPLHSIGEPEDIAFALLYLASDASRFVTGQVLRPNGGVVMP